jgi:hypothetical protein
LWGKGEKSKAEKADNFEKKSIGFYINLKKITFK